MTVRAVKWEDLDRPELDQMIYNLVKPPYEIGIADTSAMEQICYGRCVPPDPIFISDLSTLSMKSVVGDIYEEWKDGPGKDGKMLFLEIMTPFYRKGEDKSIVDVERKFNCDWRALTGHIPDNNHLKYNQARAAIYSACRLEACFPQNKVFLLSEDKEYIRTPKLMNNLGSSRPTSSGSTTWRNTRGESGTGN
ncbi:MAG: hypothetical protein V1887_04690 [Candidatus Aenigmatarchaeota archaeon]